VPPIAIIVPAVFMVHYLSLLDTRLGLVIVDTLTNPPIAVLVMKSFHDDVPAGVDEAAMIDAATRPQIFWRVLRPRVNGDAAVTADRYERCL
jgi:multiple sugar transport system permease protein